MDKATLLRKLHEQVSPFDKSFQYTKLDKISSGSYGKVYKGEHKTSKRKVALKVMRKTISSCKDRQLLQLLNEINILKEIRHANIAEYIDSFIVHDTVWIVSELIDGMDLSHLNKFRVLTSEQLASICKDSLLGLKELHDKHVIHRDVKPENILLGSDGVTKLIDFGLSERDGDAKRNLVGTFVYLAPELARGENYDCTIDVWALGITLLTLITRKNPWGSLSSDDLLDNIEDHGRPPSMDGVREDDVMLRSFLETCLEDDRPSAAFMLSHPFIQKAASKDNMGKLLEQAQTIEKFMLGPT